jgi:hypothetical protein
VDLSETSHYFSWDVNLLVAMEPRTMGTPPFVTQSFQQLIHRHQRHLLFKTAPPQSLRDPAPAAFANVCWEAPQALPLHLTSPSLWALVWLLLPTLVSIAEEEEEEKRVAPVVAPE